jgi:short-subunit dehydrogenase
VQLKNSVALVTGASSGIGRAVALRLAAQGAHVLVHGRDPQRVQEVAANTQGAALVADLSVPDERRRLVSEAIATSGRIDILVNNAGIGWAGPMTRMPPEVMGELVEVNLLAPMDLTRMVLPGMVTQRRGSICFITSVAGRTGVAGEAVYAATKSGLDAFAESVRAEAVGSGVHLCVVVPGPVATEFFAARGVPYTRSRPRALPPGTVAEAVVRAIARDEPEVWTPRWLRTAPVVQAVAPRPYRRLSARFGGDQRLAPRQGSTWP